MNENAKTLTFVAIAAAVVLLAVVTRPSLSVSRPEDVRNQPLYPKFTNPLAVTSLEIVEFDDQRGQVHPFRVAQVDVKGAPRWSIPSHDDYPADAKDQVAQAAAGLMGLKVIEMVSTNQGDEREYGVIDPDPSKPPKLGETGVGTRVIMKDADGNQLLALVIGKEVPGRANLRYVRKVGESPIYIVEVKTDKLSTKFENWIERNLLGINSFDMKQARIHDYAIRLTNQGPAIVQRGKMRIDYSDTAEPHWKLDADEKFVVDDKAEQGWRWAPVKMPADEELNAAKLDELKSALDDLKIVDVSRKPAGLSADLKVAANFPDRGPARESLEDKGFFPAQLQENGPVEIYSNEGEIRLLMKDGVEYVLRFGDIAGSGPSKMKDKAKDAAKDGNKEQESKTGTGLNRYLFVMAEFNPDMIAKPTLEPLPEVKKEADKTPANVKKADDKKADDKKADEKKSADTKADQKKPDAGKSVAKPEDAAKAERERIEKENKRKQDEYDQKVADGKKHVGELNARFADWYYVISDDVYRKIHLGHDDIFKKKEKPKDQAAGKKDQHAGSVGATPSESLERLKAEGPGGK